MLPLAELPPLDEWRPTRDSLHAYAKVLGAIRREAVEPHPRWWHVSLLPGASGLTTGALVAEEQSVRVDLDLVRDQAVAQTIRGPQSIQKLGEVTAEKLGEELVARLGEVGLEVDPPAERWRDASPREYDSGAAHRYQEALTAVVAAFAKVRDTFEGDVSPIQLWPHHFDLSFEWFGERRIEHEEGGERTESPAQIGFGFSTGDETIPEAYFYANPWPFDEKLTSRSLPGGASWQTEGFEGSALPYAKAGDGTALAEYLRAVYELASPGLS